MPTALRGWAGEALALGRGITYTSDARGAPRWKTALKVHPGAPEVMARSDLIVALVKGGATGDRNLVRTSAEAIIADERAKQHNILADRLVGALRANGSGVHFPSPATPENPARGPSARDLVVDLVPRRKLEEMLLPVVTRAACETLIEEQRRADLLRSHGLEPRHRVLLVGPPGNGKTTLAEAIAEALGVPLLVVRYEAVIGSFLGETASRLRRVFDYARTTPCVLFFDEFDVVGKERGDIHETGEIKRVVSSVLLQIDDLPSWSIVATATNHPELLDRAVWRRFQLRLDLPAPTRSQTADFIERFFRDRQLSRLPPPQEIARALTGASFAETEEFCLAVLRGFVLSLGEGKLDRIVARELKQWRARATPGTGSKSVRRGRAAAPPSPEA